MSEDQEIMFDNIWKQISCHFWGKYAAFISRFSRLQIAQRCMLAFTLSHTRSDTDGVLMPQWIEPPTAAPSAFNVQN